MKTFHKITMLLALAASTAINTSCQKSEAAAAAAMPENGAQFKKGEGLSLTDEMRESIGLKVEDVTEEKVESSVKADVSTVGPRTASGWITPSKAASLKPGQSVKLESNGESLGATVKKITPPVVGSGEAEIVVTATSDLPPGSAWTASIELPAGDAVPAIPASALLKTAEGTFVYTANGKFFVRTPVTVGAANSRLVEITDGLYAGDQVVASPVMSLWMAELQVLRGGKACTCGH